MIIYVCGCIHPGRKEMKENELRNNRKYYFHPHLKEYRWRIRGIYNIAAPQKDKRVNREKSNKGAVGWHEPK